MPTDRILVSDQTQDVHQTMTVEATSRLDSFPAWPLDQPITVKPGDTVTLTMTLRMVVESPVRRPDAD